MFGYYPFEITSQAKKSQRILVIFTSCAVPDSEELAECIESYCDDKSSPERIIVIGPKTQKTELTAAIETGKFDERVKAIMRYYHAPIVDAFFFDWEGKVPKCHAIDRIKRIGMTHVFEHRSALLQTPPTHHYEKPSGKHSTQFLRVGNAMVAGSEVDFIAFCCLPFMPRELKHIYCDTGAIAPIANSINTLRNLADSRIPRATVDSFRSYEGAEEFRFRNMTKSIVLISASTSEGLSELLVNKMYVSRERIVTVFHLSKEPFTGKVVCDLKKDHEHNPDGFEPFDSYPADDCDLCNKRNSTKIRIAGDQFLTGDTTVEEVDLKAEDANGIQQFLQNTVGKGLIRANYSEAGTLATSEVFFHLERMFDDPEMLGINAFREKFEWIVDHRVPAALRRIITLDDPASIKMGQLIRERVHESIGDIPILRFSEAKSNATKDETFEGATLVVASAVASGRNLYAVSQMLRNVQKNDLITYVVGLARLPSSREFDRIRDNVTYGLQGRKYGFHYIEATALPLYGPLKKTSWDEEEKLLNRIMRTCEDEEALELIQLRHEALLLSGKQQEAGMENTLFWSATTGVPLKLRRGFAFFRFSQSSEVSQADVFFTVVSVLHHLRSGQKPRQSLRQHEHVRRVISPRCFERFTDGIIQAALLRAAHPAELDYSSFEPYSNDMAQIAGAIFDNMDSEAGEASREFSLAFALKKLRLSKAAMNSLIQKYADNANDPFTSQLWRLIREDQ